MTNEATRKRIEAILKESWNSKDWKTGYKVGAKEFHDIGYNEAIEDVITKLEKVIVTITYEHKGKSWFELLRELKNENTK